MRGFLVALLLMGAFGCRTTVATHAQIWSKAAKTGDAPTPTMDETIMARWPERDDAQVLSDIIGYLEQRAAMEPSDVSALTHLSHAYFLQARLLRHEGNRVQMKESLGRGVLVGETALTTRYPIMTTDGVAADLVVKHLNSIDADGMEALTWYVSNLGAYAASNGTTSLLFYKTRVTAILARMLVLDPMYQYGTPHRYWAIYLARAPAFAGGDLEQARLHFEQALTAFPDNFANACDYAQFYAVPKKDRALFLKLLSGVMAGDPGRLPDVAPEMRLEQIRAKTLLADVDRLF